MLIADTLIPFRYKWNTSMHTICAANIIDVRQEKKYIQ